MLETTDLLVKCPRWGAWPMSVCSRKSTFAQPAVAFRCQKCGSEESWRLRRGAPSLAGAQNGSHPA